MKHAREHDGEDLRDPVVGGAARLTRWLRLAAGIATGGVVLVALKQSSVARATMPAPLALMIMLPVALAVLRRVSHRAERAVLWYFAPAVRLLASVMPLLFVPPMVRALAREAGPDPLLARGELFRVIAVLVVGFCLTFVITALLAQVALGWGKRKSEGLHARPPIAVPYRRVAPSLAAAAIALLLIETFLGAHAPQPIRRAVMGLALLCATWAAYGSATQMPRGMQRVLHPLLASVLVGVGLALVFALDVDDLWSRDAGIVGRLLDDLLGLSVATLGFQLYAYRRVLVANAATLLLPCAVASLIVPFTTVMLASALGVYGKAALALVTRCVTTAVAMPIASTLDTSPGLAAIATLVSALIGADLGIALLNRAGFQDPVVRGVTMGVTTHGLGTATLLRAEPAAAAASGVALALTAIGTALVTGLPGAADLLRRLAQ